ncbi:MAG: LamG domain-containing protein [Planctomycetes bacterium]|nr:LamG domain-containing protein [Planctomycetota bacterium]
MDELLTMIDRWGTSERLCDIGPTPLADGKVDAADLEVLMGCWGQEVNDPTLLAHWTLDEASGLIAADSAGTNDGTLMGNPVWQPSGGKIGGALQFDGGPRFVTTKLVRDPAAGPLSVIAWVQGGAPGQTIISQQGGVNWLMAGTPQGALTTGLSAGGRTGKPLASAAVITDGAWHRVGFVWDGANRILYVDGIEVARDSQAALAASAGGLHIGAGSTLAAGSFWKGLIDDVRIYNRAVKP